jgi:transcriptional regulator with XRE-family HTH domain
METLRRLRTEKGLSQARLAARAEVDPSTVNQIERGAREASPATLRKLAAALDVGIADLLEDASPKAPGRSPLQASFNDVLGDLRRTADLYESLHAIQEAMDKYRELWERRLAEGDFDKTAFVEGGRALKAFWPAVTAAADAEVAEMVRHEIDPEEAMAKGEAVLLPAIARFQALSERANHAYHEKFQNAVAPNVYPFPQREAS